MAMKVKDLKEWLNTIDDEKMIAVGEDGLSLVVKGEFSYCEIGGIPDGEDEDGLLCYPEPGWEDHL